MVVRCGSHPKQSSSVTPYPTDPSPSRRAPRHTDGTGIMTLRWNTSSYPHRMPRRSGITHTGSPVSIPDYNTRVEYHVAPPDSELEDPPRPSHACDCDDINDDNVYSMELRGHAHFEDATFASSYSRKSLLGRRFQILIGMVLIFLVVIFGAAFTRSSRSHHNQLSSEDQYQFGVDKISNATISDASMPASTPNVTENQNVIPLISMHLKMHPSRCARIVQLINKRYHYPYVNIMELTRYNMLEWVHTTYKHHNVVVYMHAQEPTLLI
jgi:hypothetical protein